MTGQRKSVSGFQRAVNCEKVNIWKETNGRQGLSTYRVCVQIQVGTIFSDKSCLLFLEQDRGRRTPPQRESVPCFYAEGRGELRAFSASVISHLPPAQKRFVWQSAIY